MLAAAEEVEHGATQYWLSQGKEILNNQCASCHGAKDPLKYSTENWVRHMSRMSPKAKLSEDQAKYLRVYTLALIKTAK
jgi:mono/diheme cytochrome c family protein